MGISGGKHSVKNKIEGKTLMERKTVIERRKAVIEVALPLTEPENILFSTVSFGAPAYLGIIHQRV